MANSVVRQLIKAPTTQPDGTIIGKYIVKIILVTDGTGEFSNQRINVTSGDMGTKNTLYRVWGHLPGYSGTLLWDATSKVKCLTLPKDKDINFKLLEAPLPNNAGAGITGDILLNTAGAATVTGDGFLLLEFMCNG